MLSNSADRELGGAQHSFLCYPLARASVGETLELGMTQWLGAGGTSTHMLMFACCPGPPPRMPTRGLSLLSFHRGSFGFPHSVMAGFHERAPQRKPVEARSLFMTYPLKSWSVTPAIYSWSTNHLRWHEFRASGAWGSGPLFINCKAIRGFADTI